MFCFVYISENEIRISTGGDDNALTVHTCKIDRNSYPAKSTRKAMDESTDAVENLLTVTLSIMKDNAHGTQVTGDQLVIFFCMLDSVRVQ